MAERVTYPSYYLNRGTHGFFDDFGMYTTVHNGWTTGAADTNATVSCDADGTGGILQLYTGDATDNNEVGVRTTNERFLPAIGKPMLLESRIQYTEINTNAANVCFGAADVMAGANTLLDDGAGPAATFYGALIYKVDGETVWRCATSAGALSSTGTTTQSTTTAGGASYQVLRIELLPLANNTSETTFFVDDLPLRDSNGLVIKHYLTHGAAATADLDVGLYAKAGGTGQLTVNCDYICAFQKR